MLVSRCGRVLCGMHASLLLALALLSLLCLSTPTVAADSCSSAPPLSPGQAVYTAVLVVSANASQPLGDWPDFMQQSKWGPPILTKPDAANLAYTFYNNYYTGLSMWLTPMNNRPFPNLPFAGGGGADMRVRFINIGSADGSTAAGFSSVFATSNAANVGSDGKLIPGSLVHRLMNDTHYAEFGASAPFTFVIIPPYTLDSLKIAIADHAEEHRGKIVIDTFNGNIEPWVCGDPDLAAQFPHAGMEMPDCTARGRLPGQRRFSTLFGILQDPAQCAVSAFDVFHTLGVRRVAVVTPSPSVSDTYPYHAALATVENAETVNIDAARYHTQVDCTAAPCKHSWPGGKSSEQMAREIMESGTEVVLMIAGARSGSVPLLAQLIRAFRTVGYSPKNIYMAGGLETTLQSIFADDLTLLDFISYTSPWMETLRGPNYRSFNTPKSLELYPAVPGGDDSPMVWKRAHIALGNPHALAATQIVAMVAYAALNIAQKIIELGKTNYIPALLTTAVSMAEASPLGLLNFDPTGRISNKYQVLLQRGSIKGKSTWPAHVTYPFNVAQPLIYPMPTWEERVPADVNGYNEFNEENRTLDNAIIGVNTVVLVGCIVLLALIYVFRSTSVIRSSTPWFCALNVVGCMLMLIGNYLTLTTVTSAMCAGQVWFLTLGFDITYGSLFFKTFRIWRIFGRQKLRVLKMKDTALLGMLAALLASDFLINAIWQGAYGMDAVLVVPDPIRPALNYNTCRYDDESMAFIWAHIACKATLLFCGVLVGYAVRNVPSAFNEATFIALSIYNVSIVSAFVVPIVSTGLGGRVASLSIRAYAIMFISTTTLLILFVPKLMRVFGKDSGMVQGQTMTHADDDLQSSNEALTPGGTHMQKISGIKASGGSGGGVSGVSGVRGGQSMGPASSPTVSAAKAAFTVRSASVAGMNPPDTPTKGPGGAYVVQVSSNNLDSQEADAPESPLPGAIEMQ